MEFVKSLRPEHLQSFWYSASKYCFALVASFITLLWATAPTKEEAEAYKAKLEEYRWILRLSSKSADFLEKAISMVSMSSGVLIKAIPEKPDFFVAQGSPAQQQQHRPSEDQDASVTSEAEIQQYTTAEGFDQQPTPASTEYSESLWYGGSEVPMADFNASFASNAANLQQPFLDEGQEYLYSTGGFPPQHG
jgi:hypothetical protein